MSVHGLRTYTCANCGAAIVSGAAPGTTIACAYCGTELRVPQAGLEATQDAVRQDVKEEAGELAGSPMLVEAGPDEAPRLEPASSTDAAEAAEHGAGQTRNAPDSAPGATLPLRPEDDWAAPDAGGQGSAPEAGGAAGAADRLSAGGAASASEPGRPAEHATILHRSLSPTPAPPPISGSTSAAPDEAIVVPPERVRVIPPGGAGASPPLTPPARNRTSLLVTGVLLACCLLPLVMGGLCALVNLVTNSFGG